MIHAKRLRKLRLNDSVVAEPDASQATATHLITIGGAQIHKIHVERSEGLP